MDFSLTPDQHAFRERVRSWLKANIPSEWKALGAIRGPPRRQLRVPAGGGSGKLFDGGFIGAHLAAGSTAARG